MNEKGFAATSILYTILVVFILIMFSMISLLYSRNNLLNTIQTNIKDDIQDILQQYEFYENGSVVYFNPETATVCSPANAVSTTGTKTGCMKWYIFNDHSSNGYVNLLLDHNTTAAVAWNSGGNNADGMKEIKDALNNDISTWDADVKLTARLITADEVALITGARNALSWDSTKNFASTPDLSTQISWYYLDGAFGNNNTWQTQIATSKGASKYSWLYDYSYSCTDTGCNVSDSSNYGYWTSTPVTGVSTDAWRVNRKGLLYYGTVSQNSHGLRPVIQVNKKNIIVNPTNLVVNGDLALKNNTNFTNFKYDEDEFGGYVSYTGNTRVSRFSDEYIAIDLSKKYNLSFDLKSSNTIATYYVGFREYDIDKKTIDSDYVMYIDGSLTSLKKDLKAGDTVVYLDDVSGFKVTSSTPTYQRGFIFWNYKDSTGYQYPAETYSRNRFSNIFDYGSIDTVNNTITLRSAWTGNTISAGTKLSQCSSGSTYNYIIKSGQPLNTQWTSYADQVSSINATGTQNFKTFRYGTVYVKPFVWFNYNETPDTTVYVKNVSLTVID